MNEKCEINLTQLNDYLDGNLSTEEQASLLKHINSCKSCSTELKELKLTLEKVRTLKNIEIPEAKETFSREIIDKLESETRGNKIFRVSFYKYAAASIITVALVSFALINIWPNNKTDISSASVAQEYTEDFDAVFEVQDTSIIADAGFPVDEWGLIDIDGI